MFDTKTTRSVSLFANRQLVRNSRNLELGIQTSPRLPSVAWDLKPGI
ncbi:hypothetical protein NC99_35440 [Sunxiuqinia dokdonensis]|uniref:Uncharacterized protein n=1 Tax=Sunxiuqinia dokdonensis TaxID=1409788 RepID=A0A0L8V5A7_9BACT|nr:hypothetical protein NC99_35440 [Sunxiuqinia dokdonensis]